LRWNTNSAKTFAVAEIGRRKVDISLTHAARLILPA